MSFFEAKDLVLSFLLGGSLLIVAFYIRTMSESIIELTKQLGQILTHISYIKENQYDHGQRIRRLEERDNT